MYRSGMKEISKIQFKYTVLSVFSDNLLAFRHSFTALRSFSKLSIE